MEIINMKTHFDTIAELGEARERIQKLENNDRRFTIFTDLKENKVTFADQDGEPLYVLYDDGTIYDQNNIEDDIPRVLFELVDILKNNK